MFEWFRAKRYGEDDFKALLDLVPSDGRLNIAEAAKKLDITKRCVVILAGELSKKNLLKIKHHIVRRPDLVATSLLVGRREREFLMKQIVSKEGVFKRVITPADELFMMVQAKEEISTKDAGMILNVDEKVIERWAKNMQDLVSVVYPINVVAKPIIKIEKEGKKRKEPLKPSMVKGKLLESYEIISDKVPARVKLVSSAEESLPLYLMELPETGEATLAILNYITRILTDGIQVQAEDISDPKRMLELRDRFFYDAMEIVREEMPTLSAEDIGILSGIVLHKAYGLGDVELLMADDWLEEVCINTSHFPLTVYHKKYGWMKTNILLDNEKAVYNYAAQIGRKIDRNITSRDPLMDAHLLGGDRVCASLFPISSFGNTITIRKFARRPWTVTHFMSPEYYAFSKEICAFLWLCFQYELNVVIGGGTASGKTSMLNCLCSLIQPTQRIVSVEDTRELNLPKYLHLNWIPLTKREPNPERQGEISMLDLIIASLRMRPDRIIVGEIRRREEAEVLFEAMHTGHSVYSTMHADTARNLKRRLLEPPIGVPSAEIEALHLIVIQHRDRTTGKRKTFEVAEIIPGTEGKEFDLNYLFRWNPRTREFAKINESKRIYNDLNLHTGMSKDEIEGDLREKEMVLEWMLGEGMYDIDEVADVMDRYYKDHDSLLNEIRSVRGG